MQFGVWFALVLSYHLLINITNKHLMLEKANLFWLCNFAPGNTMWNIFAHCLSLMISFASNVYSQVGISKTGFNICKWCLTPWITNWLLYVISPFGNVVLNCSLYEAQPENARQVVVQYWWNCNQIVLLISISIWSLKGTIFLLDLSWRTITHHPYFGWDIGTQATPSQCKDDRRDWCSVSCLLGRHWSLSID